MIPKRAPFLERTALTGRATNRPPTVVAARIIAQKYPFMVEPSPRCFSTVSFFTHTSNKPIKIKAKGTTFNKEIVNVRKELPILRPRSNLNIQLNRTKIAKKPKTIIVRFIIAILQKLILLLWLPKSRLPERSNF